MENVRRTQRKVGGMVIKKDAYAIAHLLHITNDTLHVKWIFIGLVCFGPKLKPYIMVITISNIIFNLRRLQKLSLPKSALDSRE